MNIINRSEVSYNGSISFILNARTESFLNAKESEIAKAFKKSDSSLVLRLNEANKTTLFHLKAITGNEAYFLPSCLRKKTNEESFAFLYEISGEIIVVVYKDNELTLTDIYKSDSFMDLGVEIHDLLGNEATILLNVGAKQALASYGTWDSVLSSSKCSVISKQYLESSIDKDFLFNENLKRELPLKAIGAVLFLALLGAGGYFAYNQFISPQASVEPVKTVFVDEYESYKMALNNLTLSEVFEETVTKHNELAEMKGWLVDSIKLESGINSYALSNSGVDYVDLLSMLDPRVYQLDLGGVGVTANSFLPYSDKSMFSGIMKTQHIALYLKDASKSYDTLPVQGETIDNGNWLQVNQTVAFQSVSLDELKQFVTLLDGLPILLDGIDLTKTGLLWSGTLKLTILGK